MSVRTVLIAVVLAGWCCLGPCQAQEGYAIVVSQSTFAQPEWKKVVDALVAKHHGTVIRYDHLAQARPQLAQLFPRYACFVAKPTETTRDFVAQVHRLTRQLDDDPYTDALWGILTGYDAGNALRIAQEPGSLVIRRVAAGTEIALEQCEEGIWHSELQKQHVVRKELGQAPLAESGPADSTGALADTLNDYKADLFVTSGHATERDWQIGFHYRNGSFRSEKGQLWGVDTDGRRHPVQSEHSRVYLAVGNCLMGHIDGPDAMALAWLKSAGVRQMAGYTVDTWFGYAGWGLLDYFVEQPGRFTLAEAFFANQQSLLHKLETQFPEDARKNPAPGERVRNGLLYDRDVLAFYGDPAWEAKMKQGNLAWAQELTEKGGVYTFVVTPRWGEKSFQPVNTNGSQRGGRPLFAFLPHRVKDVRIIEGSEFCPVVTDNFILVPLQNKGGRVVFRATAIQ